MTEIEDNLRTQLRALAGKRVVLLGIGNTERGDDGAGVVLARRLIGRGKDCVVDGGASPENYLGPIRAYAPEVVLIADATSLMGDRSPWKLLSRDDLLSLSSSTHGLSPALVMEFLEQETGADVFLLGISAAAGNWGDTLSPAVEKTISKLERLLLPLLPD